MEMIYFSIVLIIVSCLPLVFLLVKRRRLRRILKEGIQTTAEVKEVIRKRSHDGGNFDTVHFQYLPHGSGVQQPGVLITKAGKYSNGENFQISYLPHQPSKYVVHGSQHNRLWILGLVVFIAFIIYASIQLLQII